jgi:hypothetical protein
MPDPRLLFDYLCARFAVDPHDDRGMTTTEVVMGVIYAAAKGNADNIPTPAQPG